MTAMIRTGVLALGVLVVQLALAAPAAAEPSKKEQAEVRYDQGKAYYRAGAFDLAIQEFLAGYALDPRAGVLFNIARGYEELKDRNKAIEFYKKYVDLGAQATAATEARARMVVLERQIKEDDERKKAEAAERERQRQEALNPPPAMPAPVATVPPAPDKGAAGSASGASGGGAPGPEGAVGVTAPPPASPELARNLKISGLAAGGVGVVLTGLGVFFAVRGSSLKSDINSEIARTNTWTPGLASKDSDMKSANKLAVISLVAGGVTLAGGAVLYYLGWSKTPHEGGASAMLSPSVGPGGAGSLVLTGRF
jgi:Tetratricopeptide repeat